MTFVAKCAHLLPSVGQTLFDEERETTNYETTNGHTFFLHTNTTKIF